MEYTIQKILEFHDLFLEENDLDVRTILMKYSREYIVRSCHVLCNNYGNAAFIHYIINIIRPSALTNISGKRQITA